MTSILALPPSEITAQTLRGESIRDAYLILGNGIDGPGLISAKTLAHDSYLIRYIKDGYFFAIVGEASDISQELDQRSAFEFFAETVRATTSGVATDDKGWAVAQKLVTGICSAYDLSVVPADQLPEALRPPSKIMFLRESPQLAKK